MLTLCDVLEAEFVNLDRDADLSPDVEKDLPAYQAALADADAKLAKKAQPTKKDPAYWVLRERHLKALRCLESQIGLPPEDPKRKAAQAVCDKREEPRFERLLKFQRIAERSALCFSGGGIRSATFCLGVLQGLSHHHLLTKIDYLSTVSGGGYIGSWLSAWRTRNSMAEIEKSLRDQPQTKLDGEIQQVAHLRSYSNYLSPDLGVLSADTWTLAATVIRNMFLNWMILVPMLAAALLIPKLAVATTLALPLNPYTLSILLIAGFILVVRAVRNINRRLPSFGKLQCSERDYLKSVLAPLSASAILLNTFWVGWYRSGRELSLFKYCLFGGVLHLFGWLSMSDGSRAFAKQRQTMGVLSAVGEGMKALKTPTNGWFLLAAIITGVAGGWSAHAMSVMEALNPLQHPARIVCVGFPAVMAIYFFSTALFIGLASKRTNDEDREWWARSGGWILIVSSAWAVASTLVIAGPILIHWMGVKLATAGGLVGLASGWFGSLAGKSAKSGAEKKKEDDAATEAFSSKWFLKIALDLAPLIFLIALLLAISFLADYILERKLVPGIEGLPALLHRIPGAIRRLFALARLAVEVADPHPMTWMLTHWDISFPTPPDVRPLAVLILGTLSAALAWVMGHYVNVNTFSLHAMYRTRLIRAYLGASNPDRNPSLFTGFDEDDNIPMHELATGKPFHIINMALNLVHGKNLAWQERKAETFTVSRLHAGSARVGFQSTEYYGDHGEPGVQKHGITLGTAMAISGAAASPNMGYHSSPLLTFLMTFFNARLGWWLANPGFPGRGLWGERGPSSAVKSLVAEALGQTDDQNPYIYLSDGGHFENLGVYEMVLRRCHTIIVIDAGADPEYQFEDLANAIRKVRVDLGVTIHFEKPIAMKKGIAENAHCAIGHISYNCVDGADAIQGTLIYIKPVLDPTLSVDLDQYHSVNQAFPQQPTSDQFFGEAQFESYRRLGLETIDVICENLTARQVMTVAQLATAAGKHSGPDKKVRNVC